MVPNHQPDSQWRPCLASNFEDLLASECSTQIFPSCGNVRRAWPISPSAMLPWSSLLMENNEQLAPWCWNMYQHYTPKSISFVAINQNHGDHGASEYDSRIHASFMPWLIVKSSMPSSCCFYSQLLQQHHLPSPHVASQVSRTMCAAQQGAESPAAWCRKVVCSCLFPCSKSNFQWDISGSFSSSGTQETSNGGTPKTIEGHIWWGYSLKFRPLHGPYGRYLQ